MTSLGIKHLESRRPDLCRRQTSGGGVDGREDGNPVRTLTTTAVAPSSPSICNRGGLRNRPVSESRYTIAAPPTFQFTAHLISSKGVMMRLKSLFAVPLALSI